MRPKTNRSQELGFTLIELLIVIIIIGILTAIAIPMFFSQRDKAKDAATKEGVHNISIGIAGYGIDHGDIYPATGTVDNTSLASYVDNWPQNPWTGVAMTDGTGNGDYTYTLITSGSFTIVGHLAGNQDFTVK